MPDKAKISRTEFIALIAIMSATVAFSIDAMLPALPEIAGELSPGAPNTAQLVITSFVLGMGIGTFFSGPLSDRYGRKPVILAGAALYILAAIAAVFAQTLEMLLLARLVQGLGASGPRVVAIAVIRDLYAGRAMAQILSFVMIIFVLIPAVAPALGAGIIAVVGWRGVFGAFMAFASLYCLWMVLRLPETHPPEKRRPINWATLTGSVREMFAHPVVRLSIFAQCLCFGMLFALLSTVQQIFDVTFDRGDSFPFWFGAIALVSGSSALVNAALVMRLGMRVLVTGMLAVQVVMSSTLVLAWILGISGEAAFALFLVWQAMLFFQAGITLGNLNAIAMEPMGHIAGSAASVIGAVATVGGAAFAAPVGLLFDGTPLPLAIAILLAACVALALLLRMRRVEARQPA